MIHYHGVPMTPESVMVQVLRGRHAFVSFAHPEQIEAVAAVCSTFALDNGAFSAWRSGNPTTDWTDYYDWVDRWRSHPACDWAVIPDVVDGSESENDALVDEWPFPPSCGVPVWHLNEDPSRLARLAARFPRVALGSTSQYDASRPKVCLARIREALPFICRPDGSLMVKLHGLRMLNPAIFTQCPLASADSTNVARNIKYDKRWVGPYQPKTHAARGVVMTDRIEFFQSPPRMLPSDSSGVVDLFPDL